MQTVTVSTELKAPAELVWAAVKTPHAFVHAARGMLRYPAAERVDRPWREGDRLRGWMFLFGLVPAGVHHLKVAEIDEGSRVVQSEEHDTLVRTWNHRITVTPLDETTCHYEDRIDIEAGSLTSLIAAFARVFYRFRQSRWRRLAPLLDAVERAKV